ncbi:hypothetical protein PR202_gb23100 [Eleusine coracana subsp. coracana]|uniref:Uncharacterized protein n=1 Tax=Eleusine coracana subsp. coracana TaxID=191504 RepID=A0AAV5FJL8_ELECO|nr:hypothetical protein PR202_gb23100 [Eleusine coracana subsp. coracana]
MPREAWVHHLAKQALVAPPPPHPNQITASAVSSSLRHCHIPPRPDSCGLCFCRRLRLLALVHLGRHRHRRRRITERGSSWRRGEAKRGIGGFADAMEGGR